MAIKPCNECGAPASDKAENCPRCGAKQPKETSTLTWICLGMLGLALLIWFYSDNKSAPSELSAESKAMRSQAASQVAIQSILKDPDSAKFTHLTANCGTVNSKNSFGGYTGEKRFISVENTVHLEGYTTDKSEMDKLWKSNCLRRI